MQPGYVPTQQDVLRARIKSTGNTTFSVIFFNVDFKEWKRQSSSFLMSPFEWSMSVDKDQREESGCTASRM